MGIKNIFLFSRWLDWIFPPFCAGCAQWSEIKYYCAACWACCAGPDPSERCPHCFCESEGLCSQCKKKTLFSFPRAFVFERFEPAVQLAHVRQDLRAFFAILQFAELSWPLPDVVIPVPGSQTMAKEVAKLLDRPYAHILKRGNVDVEAIDENLTILVIDTGCCLQTAHTAVQLLEQTLPQKGFLLSLFPY